MNAVTKSNYTESIRRRLPAYGLAVVAAVGAVLIGARPAAAYPVCCDLAYGAYTCPGTGSNYTCPSGYYKQEWTCYEGGHYYGCGECTNGGSCWTGTWICSAYYVIS